MTSKSKKTPTTNEAKALALWRAKGFKPYRAKEWDTFVDVYFPLNAKNCGTGPSGLSIVTMNIGSLKG